jgi:hypothetical protein
VSDRLLTLALALAALVAAWAAFGPRPPPGHDTFARPLSTELRADGLAGAARSLAAAGVPVERLRGRYGTLSEPSAAWPRRGNVLITHLPHLLPVRAREVDLLERWLKDGNALIVVAALADTPGWAAPGASPTGLLADLDALVGLAAVRDAPRRPRPGSALRESLRLPQPARVWLRFGDSPALLAGIPEVVGESDYPSIGWRPSRRAPRVTFGRTGPDDSSGAGVWLLTRGSSRIFVVPLGSAFTNRVIGQGGNAALLDRLLGATLGPGGAVIFDDVHQGAATLYTPAALADDPRLYWTIALAVAVWFVWVLGSQRLAPAPWPQAPPGEDEVVEAAAGLYARELPRGAVAPRMAANLARRLGVPLTAEGVPDWPELRRRRPGASDAIRALERLVARGSAGRRVDVREVRQRILEVEGERR